MLPGQIGLLITGIISAVALAILGVFSYLAFTKEKQQKAKEARARRREQWHESMKATAEDNFDISAEQKTQEAPQITPLIAEDEFVEDFDPFVMPEQESYTEPVEEKPKSTRNDFDFKF